MKPTRVVKDNGEIIWFLNGVPHREDGHAIEYPDGTKAWAFEGKYHREDGPAIEFAGDINFWYRHGELHREDGPALESDEVIAWYLNGIEYTLEEWLATRDWTDSEKVEFYLKWK